MTACPAFNSRYLVISYRYVSTRVSQENPVSALSNGTYLELIDILDCQEWNLILLKCREIWPRSSRSGGNDSVFFSVLPSLQTTVLYRHKTLHTLKT